MNQPAINCIKWPGLPVVLVRSEIYLFRCDGMQIRAAASFTGNATKDYFLPQYTRINRHS